MQDFTPPGETVAEETTGAQLDDFLSQVTAFLGSTVQAAADPFISNYLQRQELGKGGTIHYGRIQMALPHVGWYRVSLDDAGGVMPCCALEAGSSSSVLGIHSNCMYQAHDEVLVQLFDYPTGAYGVILGAIPPIVDDANVVFRDWVTQGGNTGVLRDGYYTTYLTLGDEGGTIDFGNHRNLDQTTLDWGYAAATGVAIHMDPFMAYMRVDEMCGLTLHYIDQHLTLAAYNGDLLTATSTIEWRNDEGENTYYLGETPYPWEMLGKFEAGDLQVTENTDEDVHFEQPVGKFEPTNADQMPYHRYEEYGGYLGQGRIRQMSLPPRDVSAISVNLPTIDLMPTGVFREHIGLDGQYSLASARGVSIAKKTLIPIPKRLKQQEALGEDVDSAANANYKFAGRYGSGDNVAEHKVTAPSYQGDDQELLTTAGILDVQAQIFNWQPLNAFYYHKNDYHIPEEGDTEFDVNQSVLEFDSLSQDMWLPQVVPHAHEVDHRQTTSRYFEVLSHLTLTDDGGIVLQGGHGEEIRFTQGAVEISAPAGIYLRSGKTVALMGGDDVIVRGRKSVDITASDHDIRIKAERNMQLLSGNSGIGGTLIENKAFGTRQDYPDEGGESITARGVVIKAANSIFASLTQEVYLRTGNKHIESGPIVLDASQGKEAGDVRILANDVRRFISGSDTNVFRSGTQIRSISSASAEHHVIGSGFGVNGSLSVNGSGQFIGGINALGHFASRQGGTVGKIRNTDVLTTQIETGTSKQVTTQRGLSQTDFDTEVDQRYYDANKVGNDDMGQKISASLREEVEYCTTGFKMSNVHYQTLMEATGSGVFWSEPSVKYQDSREQQPWPGRVKWSSESTLLTLPADNFNMYDVEAGKARNRGEVYEEPQIGPFVPAIPSSAYRVVDC